MKKLLIPILIAVYFLALFYLLLPTPKISNLPDSFKSIEPGDTVQIPGVSAYYTNMSRSEILEFYRREVNHSSLFNLPMPYVLLNHPIQYGRLSGYFNDQTKSTYVEEFVHPLRGLLIINGFMAKDSYALKAIQTPAKSDNFFINNKAWDSKVTIKYVDSNPLLRVTVFTLVYLGFIALYQLFIRTKNEA